MASYYKTEGFVFKKEDSLEADRVFSVFTKDFGRIEIVGKAIRKINSKLRGGIEIFSLSRVEFIEGKTKKTLTDAVFLEKFKYIYESLEKLETAYKVSNILDNFIRGEEKDGEIFNLLNDTFSRLNNYLSRTADYQLIYYYFFWNFISILGYQPELLKCANCQQKLNPYKLYFSNKEGGVICKNCSFLKRDGVKIKSDVVKILRLILSVPNTSNSNADREKDWMILSKLKTENILQKSLKEISDSYYSYLGTNLAVRFKDE